MFKKKIKTSGFKYSWFKICDQRDEKCLKIPYPKRKNTQKKYLLERDHRINYLSGWRLGQ